MKINKVTENFSVSGQITVDDLKELAKLGYKTIICNRPDEEVETDLQYDAIKAEAEKHGLSIHYLPIHHQPIRYDLVMKTKNMIEDHPKPIFAYCRTGTRSITYWAMASAPDYTFMQAFVIAQNAGYDLGFLSDIYEDYRKIEA